MFPVPDQQREPRCFPEIEEPALQAFHFFQKGFSPILSCRQR